MAVAVLVATGVAIVVAVGSAVAVRIAVCVATGVLATVGGAWVDLVIAFATGDRCDCVEPRIARTR